VRLELAMALRCPHQHEVAGDALKSDGAVHQRREHELRGKFVGNFDLVVGQLAGAPSLLSASPASTPASTGLVGKALLLVSASGSRDGKPAGVQQRGTREDGTEQQARHEQGSPRERRPSPFPGASRL
jgi:hypothetical protein